MAIKPLVNLSIRKRKKLSLPAKEPPPEKAVEPLRGAEPARAGLVSAGKSRSKAATGPADALMGKRIRLRRTELRISQETLGVKLGVSFQQIQKYEKGINRVPAGRLPAIAALLQAPISFFYDEDPTNGTMQSLLCGAHPAQSLRLLRAYNKIHDATLAFSIVELVERIVK